MAYVFYFLPLPRKKDERFDHVRQNQICLDFAELEKKLMILNSENWNDRPWGDAALFGPNGGCDL